MRSLAAIRRKTSNVDLERNQWYEQGKSLNGQLYSRSKGRTEKFVLRILNLKRCITTISLVFSHKKAWLFHWCSWDIFHSWNRKTHLKFLITKIYLTFLSFSDTLLSFSRSCYPTSGPNHCSKGVDKELKMDVILCSEFCNTDNCNSAFTSQPHPVLLLLTFSTTTILLNSLSGFHDIRSRWR